MTAVDPFNPSSEYEVPKGNSKYLRFEQGQTEFLPLASAIVGHEYWNTDNKPVRVKDYPNVEDLGDARRDEDGNVQIKHFWAFPVWDYATKSVKLLEITQKTLMTAIRAYAENTKWGNPVMRYSFTVTKSGEKLNTEYGVMANPAQEIGQDIVSAWEQAQAGGFDINRLFTGGDPFTSEANGAN